MSAVDRCTCIPHYQDAGAGLTECVPEWDPSCSEHGDIDEILASHRYTDRRGREWQCRPNWTTPSRRGVWEHAVRMANVPGGITFDILDPDQMRLLIERDQHRDVCPSLPDCTAHPVPIVIVGYDDFEWRNFKVRAHGKAKVFRTLAEAMDAARALAVQP